MNSLIDYALDPQGMLAILSAVAVFATIVFLAMPLLDRSDFDNRMRTVALERDVIRARERTKLANQKKNSRAGLRESGGNGFVKNIVDALNLKAALADENTFINLIRAGYRKQSHIYIFLFFRIALPLILLAGALLYLFVFSSLKQPPMIKLVIALGIAAIGFYAPNLWVKSQLDKRQLSIRRAWPDALDLLLICVESGISIEQAYTKVAAEIGIQSTELAEELMLTTAELSYLQERKQAYENLANRTGLDSVKAVTTALVQAERYGTPLGVALRVLAQESRDMRMAEAEKKAASLPPKLTVPMIVFFLPVLFMVILGPAIIQISRTF